MFQLCVNYVTRTNELKKKRKRKHGLRVWQKILRAKKQKKKKIKSQNL